MTDSTINCDWGDHHACGGYVAPHTYAATRPCACGCHDTRQRDYDGSVRNGRWV